jgi:hypothetical protein
MCFATRSFISKVLIAVLFFNHATCRADRNTDLITPAVRREDSL